MFDVLIKGAAVIDGTGQKAKVEDVGIKGDSIVEVGQVESIEAREIFDGRGYFLCPGFIDVHSHSDFNILAEPAGGSKIKQGVTTEVCGNCGLSAAPLLGDYKKQREKSVKALGVDINWADFKEYRQVAEQKGLPLNIVPLIGHGNLRGAVMGYENRKASASEINEMKVLLEKEMKEGAWGLSSGLIYPPGVYAGQDELVELNRLVKEFKGVYTSHIRSEGDHLIDAIDEVIGTARESGVSLQISHLKTMGEKNWNKLPLVFKKIERALDEGMDVSADRYPYIAGSTGLDAILPAWACAGGAGAEIERIRPGAKREKIFSEMLESVSEKEIAETIMIARVVTKKNRYLEGKFVGEAAQLRGQHVKDALFDLLVEEELDIDAIFFSMNEDNLIEILKKEYVMPGSDASVWGTSGPLAKGKPHPRAFGTFPRFIKKYAMEQKLFEIETAVNKMTAFPAEKFGIADRGKIKKGLKADLVMFDLDKLADNATYDDPHQYPDGIINVMVNGRWVVNDKSFTDENPGKVILKS